MSLDACNILSRRVASSFSLLSSLSISLFSVCNRRWIFEFDERFNGYSLLKYISLYVHGMSGVVNSILFFPVNWTTGVVVYGSMFSRLLNEMRLITLIYYFVWSKWLTSVFYRIIRFNTTALQAKNRCNVKGYKLWDQRFLDVRCGCNKVLIGTMRRVGFVPFVVLRNWKQFFFLPIQCFSDYITHGSTDITITYTETFYQKYHRN